MNKQELLDEYEELKFDLLEKTVIANTTKNFKLMFHSLSEADQSEQKLDDFVKQLIKKLK
jgi:hypothetical protein